MEQALAEIGLREVARRSAPGRGIEVFARSRG